MMRTTTDLPTTVAQRIAAYRHAWHAINIGAIGDGEWFEAMNGMYATAGMVEQGVIGVTTEGATAALELARSNETAGLPEMRDVLVSIAEAYLRERAAPGGCHTVAE